MNKNKKCILCKKQGTVEVPCYSKMRDEHYKTYLCPKCLELLLEMWRIKEPALMEYYKKGIMDLVYKTLNRKKNGTDKTVPPRWCD